LHSAGAIGRGGQLGGIQAVANKAHSANHGNA
jgi:hypothetical protein